MDEWFNTNASAVIAAASALLAAMIAAASTLLGTYLSHRASKSQRDDTFIHERWKMNRDLYLSKAEEILSLFEKWYDSNYQIMLLHIFVATETKSQLEANEEIKAYSDKHIKARIGSLLSLYFSELVGDFTAISKVLYEINMSYAEVIVGRMDKKEFAIKAEQQFNTTKAPAHAFIEKLAEISKTKL